MSDNYEYDLFVIGAGSGGVRAARVSASLGAKVGIAEERYLGGTCVNVGCVPKKLFVYGAGFGEEFRAAKGYGWKVGEVGFDWATLRDNKTDEIRRLNGFYRGLLESSEVDIFDERATLVGGHDIRVGDTTVSARHILVATGSWPVVPDFPGADLAITSNEAFYLPTFPRRVLVVGGGYIAVEFAGIFAGLGAKTMLAYRGDLFLRGFDEGIRLFVLTEMSTKGVSVRLNMQVASLRRTGTGLLCEMRDGQTIETDLVLLATGRAPASSGLGLETVGVETAANGAIAVDAEYRTSAPHVYAIGDVIDRAQLTPVAIAEGMAVAHNLFGGSAGGPRRVDYENIPTAIFCRPNIGSVGPTEEAARRRFSRLQVFESSFKPMKHTLTNIIERSMMKLLVDGDDDRVIAAHMCGPDAGEIIQGLGVAITAGATKADFDATIGIHPTAAEEFVTMREEVSWRL